MPECILEWSSVKKELLETAGHIGGIVPKYAAPPSAKDKLLSVMSNGHRQHLLHPRAHRRNNIADPVGLVGPNCAGIDSGAGQDVDGIWFFYQPIFIIADYRNPRGKDHMVGVKAGASTAMMFIVLVNRGDARVKARSPGETFFLSL